MGKKSPDPVDIWLGELWSDFKEFLRSVFSLDTFVRGGATGPATDWETYFPELLDEIVEEATSGKRKPATHRKMSALEQQVSREKFKRRKDFNTFMEILERVYGPRNQKMKQKLEALPIFRGSRNAWSPGDEKANDNIAHILLRQVKALVEDVYGFFTAQVQISARLRGDLDGLYNPKRRMVFIHKGLYQKPFSRFFITYMHEQMHCLQFDLMQRFSDPRERQSMDSDLGYLVQYWQAERLDYIKCFYLLNKNKKMPELYFRLGQEVHAEWIGQSVSVSAED